MTKTLIVQYDNDEHLKHVGDMVKKWKKNNGDKQRITVSFLTDKMCCVSSKGQRDTEMFKVG